MSWGYFIYLLDACLEYWKKIKCCLVLLYVTYMYIYFEDFLKNVFLAEFEIKNICMKCMKKFNCQLTNY